MSTEFKCIATIESKKKRTRYLLGAPHILIKKGEEGADIDADLAVRVPHKDGDLVTVDWKRPLPLSAVVEKNGMEYLCISKNSDQVTLCPFSPVFLNRRNELYLKTLSSFSEKRKEIFSSRKEYAETTNRLEDQHISFSSRQSCSVLEELFSISDKEKYDICPMISDLRKEELRNELRATIENGTLLEQFTCLQSVLSRFTRKSKVYSKKYFSKSRGSVLDMGLKLVSKSITGLYETEKEL